MNLARPIPNLTIVSPLPFLAFFKLKPQNVAFWAVAPTLICRYAYGQSLDDRVDNLWRIHQNREKRGMGGSFQKSGFYADDEHIGDSGMPFLQQITISMHHLISGVKTKDYLNSPFTRFDQNIQDYPEELFNADDRDVY